MTAPLADVRVLDFMWVLAGPAASRVLADYGATVVRIESSTRIDTARTLAPYRDGQPGPERSGIFHNVNAGKRMLTLDPTSAAGREVVLDLVRWADVVTESFSPGAMARLGFDYETLRGVKPDVIMLSTCLMGQTGPLARFAGYGNLAAALSGFSNLGGWPDRPPSGPFSAYTDYVSPRFVAVSILAALEHRRRTGEGQFIDCSQAEASLHFLGPALLDHAVNGRLWERQGNRDPHDAPHGVYPASGDDRWIALAVRTDAQWASLCELMGTPSLLRRFADANARLASAAELDDLVAAWTREHEAHALVERLQAAGIPASVVQSSRDLADDPQLRHRGHFLTVDHPDGPTVIEASRFRLMRTPATPPSEAPSYGRHAEEVLTTILGYDEERITTLIAAGALE